jgi:hypothetical protein
MITDEMIQDALHRVADRAPDAARVQAALARPRRPRQRGVVAVTAAAVAVGLAAVTGLVASVASVADRLTGGDGVSGQLTELLAGLTATECAELKVATGAQASVSDTSLELRTVAETTVTVTVGAGTGITRVVGGDLDDITGGREVLVEGEEPVRGGEVVAEQVGVLSQRISVPAVAASPELLSGTVTGVSGDRFAVRSAAGAEVLVVTSPDTVVTRQDSSRLDKLVEAAFTVAVGRPRPDATLAATTVAQGTLTGEAGQPPSTLFSGLGCDADAIALTALRYGVG